MNSSAEHGDVLHRDQPALVGGQAAVLPQADEDRARQHPRAGERDPDRPAHAPTIDRPARSSSAGASAERARDQAWSRSRMAAGRLAFRTAASACFAPTTCRRTRRSSSSGRSSIARSRPRSRRSGRAATAARWPGPAAFASCDPAATPFWAQASSELVSTSSRTGIEPFFCANSIWVSGSSSTRASSCCALVWLGVLQLREDEHVAAHDVGRRGRRQHGAAVFLAGGLAGGDELALGPVAHDLHAGLALDHQAVASFQLRPGLPGST